METNTTQGKIQDAIPDKQNINLMVSTALLVMQTGLFPCCNNSPLARQLARVFIKGFITRSGEAYANYAEFCQRILMARRYRIQNPDFSFSFTIMAWLDPDARLGFAGTAPWFATLQDKRKQKPLHLLELKAFPEAMLELAEERSADNFHYWNSWFMERKAWDESLMLQLSGVQLAFETANTSPEQQL